MAFPDLTPREREIAAQECEAIAAHFDQLATFPVGPHGTALATQHAADAQLIRARAERHRDRAEAQEIGDTVFRDEINADGRTHSTSAVVIPEHTVISAAVLAEALSEDASAARVLGDLLVLDLANGVWMYRLGAYNPTYRGIDAQLVSGEPIKATTP